MAYTPSTAFVFLPTAYAVDGVFKFDSGEYRGSIYAELEGVTGLLEGYNESVRAIISANLEGAGGYLFGNYDTNVTRWTLTRACSNQQDAHQSSHRVTGDMQQTLKFPFDVNAGMGGGLSLSDPVAISYRRTTPQIIKRCGTVDDATPQPMTITSVNDLLAWRPESWQMYVDASQPLNNASTAAMQQTTKMRDPDWQLLIDDMAQARHDFTDTAMGDPPPPWNYTPQDSFSFAGDGSYAPGAAFGWPYSIPFTVLALRHFKGIDSTSFVAPLQQAIMAYARRCAIVQQARRPPPGTSTPIDPERPPYEPPPGHTTITIPTRQVYTMQHIITVKTVPGDVEVPMSSVSLSYDADSFAWQFSGTLIDSGAIELVQTGTGDPVELAINIDGYLWHALVENVEHGIQFAKHSITLKGRSLTAKLGAPYVLPTSYTIGSDMTVQQIADSLMPVGWTINWDAPTWVVPAGAYSYTNQTPIQVLSTLVNDIGCVAVPHPSNQSITVQRRYPVYPWYFAAAAPDLSVPEAALKSANLRPSIPTQANAVYVHGSEVGGILAWCRLALTAGDKLLPTASNALMTDIIGCRLLGERLLSGQWQQPIVKAATLPLDGVDFPLASVGQLVQVDVGGELVKGIINSVSINAGLKSVSQSIQIGEETANVWTTFNSLLPRDPLLVGSIASTDGSVSVITLLDGGVVSARGTGAIGAAVYIRAGRIEGPAPTMVSSEIVI